MTTKEITKFTLNLSRKEYEIFVKGLNKAHFDNSIFTKKDREIFNNIVRVILKPQSEYGQVTDFLPTDFVPV